MRSPTMVCCFVLLLNVFAAVAMGQSIASEDNVMIYGEVGRARTLDPITNNDMMTLRLAELVFDGLVGYNKIVCAGSPSDNSTFLTSLMSGTSKANDEKHQRNMA